MCVWLVIVFESRTKSLDRVLAIFGKQIFSSTESPTLTVPKV